MAVFFNNYQSAGSLKMAKISKVISVLEQAADMLKADAQGESITSASDHLRAGNEISQTGCSDVQ